MDLFNHNTTSNLLPYDGIVQYYGPVMPVVEAINYFNKLVDTIEWRNDEVIIMGKHIVTKRKTAWYADKPFKYTYSKITREALSWTAELLELKKLAEQLSGASYNSCLLNLYHDGSESMGWHSDNEPEIEKDSAIASFSFGAERKFVFRHKKTGEKVEVFLQHGSLLVMKGTTQTNWLHRLPATTKVTTPRINLTFRSMNA